MQPDLKSKLVRGLPVIAVAAVIWMVPPPGNLEVNALHLVAIFVATILGLVLQPLPQGAVVLLGVSVAAVTGTLSLADSLAGFANGTVWLIVTAFLFARGFIKTGLGSRIAFLAVSKIGSSTLGLGYSLTLADLIIAPATPSNTARAGGILFPIVRSLCSSLGSEPGPTARKAGAFLIYNEFQVNLVTSAMFLTGVAPNAMIVLLAAQSFGYEISWFGWFAAAVVPAAVSLALIPLLLHRWLKPETQHAGDAKRMARSELERMGPMTPAEWKMTGVFLVTLGCWATSQWSGLNVTGIALGAVGTLLLTGVLGWDDVVTEKGAWDALVWFGGLVSLAAGLGKLGVIDFLAGTMSQRLSGMNYWLPGFILLVLAYVYLHYFVASMTAHATAFYVPFGLVAIGLGTPVALAALTLGFMNSLNAAMTHYGTGPSPIYFGAGYIDLGTWWKLGFLISVVNLLIWLLIGGFWWKVLGLW